jgi:hypothetical protein
MNIEFQQKKVCIINDTEYRILSEFTVVHPGWELDSIGYIISYKNEPRLMLSDHGEFKMIDNQKVVSFYDGDIDIQVPLDQHRLLMHVKNLKSYIKEMEFALSILQNG